MPREKIDLLKTASKDRWKTVGTKRRAGILTGLFSVYSKDSIGIGDFADLKLLIDLCADSGSSIVQLLPMNEIGSTFCPYDAISSFAVEPVYISLEAIPACGKKAIRAKMEAARRLYPAGEAYVDYAVKDAKKEILWEAYLDEPKRDAAGLKRFVEENKYWIEDFALYKVLKNHHAGKPWYEWPDAYRERDSSALAAFRKEHEREIGFQKWVQWIAYGQFVAAKEYASAKGVLIKGDLPILISRDSADVWSHPEFFKLEYAAGAPPDMYCAKGQRWGMPTYDWEEIEADDFRYPKEKLGYAGNFYDMLRIDHVVGLFRIWSIPSDDPLENEGLNGVFDPKEESLWPEHGRRILSMMMNATDMLLCAEDLGIIPKSCPEALKEFGIPGNDVERWVKDWEKKHDFLPPEEYRLLSVSMLSTHDTTNWAAWWENEAGTVDEALFVRKCQDRGIDLQRIKGNLFDPERSRHGRLRWQDIIGSKEILIGILGKREEELRDFIELYENSYREKEKLWSQLGLKGRMREKCDSRIVEAVFGIVLNANSIFSINLLNDYLYIEDMVKGDPYRYRINRPGTISRENWSLTVPLSLEELIKHKIVKKMAKLAEESRRV